MLKTAIISNGIKGLKASFQPRPELEIEFIEVDANFNPKLDAYELLIIPNGSDQIALGRIKETIAEFLAAGKTLLCFDGWFTNWMPGNQWLMDNSKKTIDIRYFLKNDPYKFLEGIELDELIFSNGISGWWACGYINAAPEATIILEDTWQRPIMIVDEKSTNGKILATASGPLGDYAYGTTDDDKSMQILTKLYQNILNWVLNN